MNDMALHDHKRHNNPQLDDPQPLTRFANP